MLGQAQLFLMRMREAVAVAAASLASYTAPTMNLSLEVIGKPIDPMSSFLFPVLRCQELVVNVLECR